ncbi:MAG: hypothetical protein DMF79_03550 [Acidobacteria bacterium]|nr:MAG: hypothetical protein DMF79_03550 [Acidobacteriota bacterium]
MSLVSIDQRDPTPIYAQLERALRAAVATSRLRPGDQLPTVRQLAVDLRINANTVARVYGELERASAPPRSRPIRRASMNVACAPSSPASWPTPTPRAAPSTM